MNLSTFDAFKCVDTNAVALLSTEQVKELQQILLGMLDDIVEVCDKYDICYTLGGGSVIGAVRHKGFIPWDDDIDINMPRSDYQRFIPLFRQELGNKYWVHTPEDTDNYGLLAARIRLKGTYLKTKEDFFTNECGVPVDIFIIENTFDNFFLRWLHGMGCMAFGLLVSCRKFWRDRKHLLELAKGNQELTRVIRVKAGIGFLTAFGSMDFWTRTANKWNGLCKNAKSNYVCIPAGRKHFFGETYRRSDVCETQKLLYEGRLYNCPKAADAYLTNLYGNYMKIPAKHEQEHHVYMDTPVLLNSAKEGI